MSRKLSKRLSKQLNSTKSEVNTSDRTVLLDSTDETDVIECSLVGYENKYVSVKNRESSLKKIQTLNVKSELLIQKSSRKVISTSKTEKLSNISIRTSIRQSYGLVDEVIINDSCSKSDSPLQTPCSKRNTSASNLIFNKIISTIKKTPDAPLLSKSKLRNIENWLRDNDVETVHTPPFANLSVTPRNSTRSKRKPIVTKIDNKENHFENTSIDSEVEDVLKAVYGDDWMQKNVHSNCKTEPKRKRTVNFSPLTEVKRPKSVRRNILKAKKPKLTFADDDLNSSAVSGVNLINLDDSNCSSNFIKTTKLTNFRNKRKFDDDSSIESLSPHVSKKTKRNEVMPLPKSETKKKENEKAPKTPKLSAPLKTPRSDVHPKTSKAGVRTKTPKTEAKAEVPLKTPKEGKTPKKTFLASLSVSTPTSRCHPDAQQFKVNFKTKKEELVKKLYKLYNAEVFDGKLAEDMNFSWNVKLRGTAGYCYNKRITKSNGDVIRLSRIEFSTKIVDRADRLRDTMIHELCHAASWVIDGILDGHGDIWRGWAYKAMKRFPELPPIKRCHNYEIVSKYVYRCTGCGYSIKRHSKSINIERKRCGHCYGVLELLLNKKKRGKGEVPEFDTTRTLRTPNKFALFVKENYHSVKSSKGNAKHAEIMKVLSEQYALVKNGTLSAKKSLEI